MSDIFEKRQKERRDESEKAFLERKTKIMSDKEWKKHPINKFYKSQ